MMFPLLCLNTIDRFYVFRINTAYVILDETGMEDVFRSDAA